MYINMPKSFIKFLNDYYNTKDHILPYNPIENKRDFDNLQKIVNEYLKNNKIKLNSIYNCYYTLQVKIVHYLFLFLVLNDYKITNKIFILHVINSINLLIIKYTNNINNNINNINYDDNEKEGEIKLIKYVIHFINSNEKIKPFFENTIIINDEDYIINDSEYFHFFRKYYLVQKLQKIHNNPFIFKPNIILNLIKKKDNFDKNLNHVIKIIEPTKK
jgi:hypothetical protein